MARAPWNGKIGKAAVLKVARDMAARDCLSWPRALRKALAWAKRKAKQPEAPAADRYAALRARGQFSPLDQSKEAREHFAGVTATRGYRPGAQKAGQ